MLICFLLLFFLFCLLCFCSNFVLCGAVSFYLLLYCFYVLWYDISIDIFKAAYDFVGLYSILQYLYIWFLSSEGMLFFTLFGSMFSTVLFSENEFSGFLIMPVPYSYTFCNYEYLLYWCFLDLYSIFINTCFLVFSGMFGNLILYYMYLNFYLFSLWACFICLLLGYLFLWNQLWEFTLLSITVSSSCFGSFLYVIDLLHAIHVLIGLCLLSILFLSLQNYMCFYASCFWLYGVLLYWHFVDGVWLFLLRCIYLDLLWII